MSLQRKILRNVNGQVRKQQIEAEQQTIDVYIKSQPIGTTMESLYTLADGEADATHKINMTIGERNVVLKTENLLANIQNFLKAKCLNFEARLEKAN
jgi:hypothetical protein